VHKADNLPTSCAFVTKSGNLNFLEPSGPLQACNGTALPLPLLKLRGLGSIGKQIYHPITVIRFLESGSDVCWVSINAGRLPQRKCFDLVRYFSGCHHAPLRSRFFGPGAKLLYRVETPMSDRRLQTSYDHVVVRHATSAGRRLQNNPITAHPRSVDGGQRTVTFVISTKRESTFFPPAKNHLPIPTVPPHTPQ